MAPTYTTTHRNKTVNGRYFQQNQCLNITKKCSTQHTQFSMGSYAGGSPGNCPACPCVKTALVLGYYPVGSSCLWVSLHNKCETSNSYYRAMTRSGMKRVKKNSNYFQFRLKFFKYYECIPKQRQLFSFKAEIYSRFSSWFMQRRGDTSGTIAPIFSVKIQFFLL